ncbi:MAG TPA: cyclic nucleotide-binding domain-containing protein [Verrucomicrobiae bacterium]|jgi:Fe-S-cluster-containing dehydrogenase component/CRP-like cAMP-binding protein|nr:cyclic nucleotide-binding domain-containing protein [Verrucomicrobiae bacterium]
MPKSLPIIDRPQRWDAAFDPDMLDAVVDALLSVPPFSLMQPKNFPAKLSLRDILKNDTRVKTFRRGEIVLRQGDYGTSAFMVLSGTVRVVLNPGLSSSVLGRHTSPRKGIFATIAQLWSGSKEPESSKQSRQNLGPDVLLEEDEPRVFLQDVPRVLNKHKTAVMGQGEFFGELAALTRMPRAASVFADSDDASLLEIRWQGLRDLMKFDDSLRKHIDHLYRENALRTALREIPIFRGLSQESLAKVIASVEFATYGDYDWSGDYKRRAQADGSHAEEPVIALEGDYPNGVIFIRSGFARVSQKFGNGERTLNYLGAGKVYGLQTIAHNWRKPEDRIPLQYTLRVMGYTHVITVPTDVMETVVLPTVPKEQLPPLIMPVENEEAAPSGPAQKISEEMLEFVTDNRFLNGTAAMLIDLDRCTRCDDCVRACAVTHDNNPRFLRHGPSSGKLMVANACMHCADPVCMIGCPTGAIHRDEFEGEVVINPATCIGCQICFNHCPYDAIRMVEIRNEEGEFLIDKESKPILRATKCDLCVGQSTGPACQRACPHGALARVNMSDIDTFANWLKQ